MRRRCFLGAKGNIALWGRYVIALGPVTCRPVCSIRQPPAQGTRLSRVGTGKIYLAGPPVTRPLARFGTWQPLPGAAAADTRRYTARRRGVRQTAKTSTVVRALLSARRAQCAPVSPLGRLRNDL